MLFRSYKKTTKTKAPAIKLSTLRDQSNLFENHRIHASIVVMNTNSKNWKTCLLKEPSFGCHLTGHAYQNRYVERVSTLHATRRQKCISVFPSYHPPHLPALQLSSNIQSNLAPPVPHHVVTRWYCHSSTPSQPSH